MNAEKIFALKVASREKAITLNSTTYLYPEVLLWIGLVQGKQWPKV
jgi:hypothetical protein